MKDARDIHLSLLRELAGELAIDQDRLVEVCDEHGAQAVDCSWEKGDEWPVWSVKKRHGWKNGTISEALGLPSLEVHTACKEIGLLFVQAGDKRAGSTALFRAA